MSDFNTETLALVKKNNAAMRTAMSSKLHEVLACFQLADEKGQIFASMEGMERQLRVVQSTPPGHGSDREEQFSAEPSKTKLVARCAEMVEKRMLIEKITPWLFGGTSLQTSGLCMVLNLVKVLTFNFVAVMCSLEGMEVEKIVVSRTKPLTRKPLNFNLNPKP